MEREVLCEILYSQSTANGMDPCRQGCMVMILALSRKPRRMAMCDKPGLGWTVLESDYESGGRTFESYRARHIN
jgi:hypothetical protein